MTTEFKGVGGRMLFTGGSPQRGSTRGTGRNLRPQPRKPQECSGTAALKVSESLHKNAQACLETTGLLPVLCSVRNLCLVFQVLKAR